MNYLNYDLFKSQLYQIENDFNAKIDKLKKEMSIEEEKKIPEKLDDFTIAVGKVDESNIEEYIQTLFNQQYEIFNKINSIIDYLKSKVE